MVCIFNVEALRGNKWQMKMDDDSQSVCREQRVVT